MKKARFDWIEFFRPTGAKLIAYVVVFIGLSGFFAFLFTAYPSNSLVMLILYIISGPFNLLMQNIPWMDYLSAMAGSGFDKFAYYLTYSFLEILTFFYRYALACLFIYIYNRHLKK